MNRSFRPPRRTQTRANWKRSLATGRAYLILSLCSMALFTLLGLAGMLQKSFAVSPVQTMKGFAASLSGRFFVSLLGMELPQMKSEPGPSPFRPAKMASFLIRFLTDLNPGDPKSLLAPEFPGMSRDEAVLLRQGSGGGEEAPEDQAPSDGETAVEHQPPPDGDTNPTASASQPESQHPDTRQDTSPNIPESGKDESPNSEPADKQSEGEQKVVFIYHSHNRESWFPELPPGAKNANSDKINVTLVGKRLAGRLEAKGIGTAHSSQDYAGTVKAYNWNLSYKYSLKTVQQALARNRSLKYFFDIHRDSQHRSKTTATIRGTDYAQVYFIIGHRNPNWKENEAFANQIHERLEKNYPGLSRGIWGKTAANGNGEYNQSVSPDSVLIEIGGVDNTLAECYRTADVLADTIADLYWESRDAKKADVQPVRN